MYLENCKGSFKKRKIKKPAPLVLDLGKCYIWRMKKEKDFIPKWLRIVSIIIIIAAILIKLLELLIKYFRLNIHLP